MVSCEEHKHQSLPFASFTKSIDSMWHALGLELSCWHGLEGSPPAPLSCTESQRSRLTASGPGVLSVRAQMYAHTHAHTHANTHTCARARTHTHTERHAQRSRHTHRRTRPPPARLRREGPPHQLLAAVLSLQTGREAWNLPEVDICTVLKPGFLGG